MSTMIAIDADCPYECTPDALSDSDLSRHRRRASFLRRRRYWVECAAAVTVGVIGAIAWAASGSGEDAVSARRVLLERQLAQLSPALAELARLDRAGESARASAAVALARARPYAELRSLLETLSGQAHGGVTVSRIRQSREGFELQVRAVDGAACASWVERLARMPGWEAAQITDLRLVATPADGRAEQTVEANVRLPSRAETPSAAPRRTQVAGRDERGGRSER